MSAPTTSHDSVARISPNGTSLNGIGFDDVSLRGVQPTGTSASGQPIHSAVGSAPWAGYSLVGSTWTGELSDGTTAALRIDAAHHGDSLEAWTYRVSILRPDGWRPLCADAGGPSDAVSVTGSWNLARGVPDGGSYREASTTFTLACSGSVIAKCVEFGYVPWTGAARELAACTRALRGDYCGDGTTYTVDGTVVNIYDSLGIQPDGVDWDGEAEWTSAGASCVAKKKAARFSQVAQGKPWCYPHILKAKKSCGEKFSDDIAIITELAPK